MLAFDIETGPLSEEVLRELCPPFDPSEIKCGNLGPEKAAEKIKKAEAEHFENFRSSAALSATTGRVLAIGYASDKLTFIAHEPAEEQLIESFWSKFAACESAGRTMVGHNIHGFDLPFLIRRSWMLGLDPPVDKLLSQGRYWNRILVDTMQRWQCGNYRDYVKLDILARSLGHNGKPDEITGADFARLYFGTEQERQQALDYLKNDLEMTRAVAIAMGII